MTRLYCDTETYSEISLKTHGSYAYSEKVEVMLFAYALDNGPVKLWDRTRTKKMPADLEAALNDPDVMTVWHNGGGFDRLVVASDMGIVLPPERIHDTMARAFSHGFPGGLDLLCDIMQPPISKAKDKDGKKLIQLFCKPRPANQKIRRATRETHPEEWEKFCKYAVLDIEAMRYMDAKMPLWNYTGYELGLWHRDQRINMRGCMIDKELCEAMLRAVERELKRLAARTDDLTLGDVQSTTQRDEILRHVLQAYGVDLPDLQASTIERRIEDPDLPRELKELLSIRLQASSTSTAKYKRFLNLISSDGRYRGALQFSGAARTKRWAARGVQLQNLPNPTMSAEDIEFGIECVKSDCEDLFFKDIMELARCAVRGCIVAPPEHKLYISDLSNIEGRDAAWIAGEDWKLQAFSDFDHGLGPDLYKLAYAIAFRISHGDVTKAQRQVGKVMELMLQYAGGVGAFVTGALTYGIDLQDMANRVLEEVEAGVREEAEDFFEWRFSKGATLGLPRDIFVACDSLKRLWRRNHPRIVTGWDDIAEAARNAIDSKDRVFKARRLSFERKGNWMRMVLPSGFFLCYPGPRVSDKGEISFMGVNQYNRKWSRLRTYGGKLFENACQATARDVMAWNMEGIEDAGYNIILSVHDELITEAPDNQSFSHRHLSELLATNPPWAAGLPLAAGGFESHRYRKGG
jgi:DNA polymerase